MNKSKFLKKSLAMVLAVMMIVAMIPLGASAAATPEISAVSVGSGAAYGAVTNYQGAKLDGTTYTAEITDPGADKVFAQITLKDGEGFVYHDTNDQSVSGTTVIEFTDDEKTARKASIVVFDADNVEIGTYTIAFTVAAKNDDATIKSVTTAGQYGTTAVAGTEYTVTVPYATASTVAVDVALNSTKSSVTATGVTGSAGTYQIPGITVGAPATSFTVTTEAGRTQVYSVKVVKAKAFTAFSINNQRKDAQIYGVTEGYTTVNTVEVYLPYGTKADSKGAYKFTPTFSTGYSSVVVKSDPAASTVKKKGTTIKSGTEINLADYTADTITANAILPATVTVPVTVNYTGSVSEQWSIKVNTATSDPVPEIKSLKINNFVGVINGTNITVEVPKNVRAAATTIDLGVSTGEKVDVVGTAVTDTAASDAAQLTDTAGWLADGKNNFTLRVTANADPDNGGKQAVKDYKLTIKTAEAKAAQVTKMVLKDADDKEYTAAIDQGKNTITFTVPYKVRDTADLAGYKLFYEITSGSTIKNATSTNDLKATGTALVSADLTIFPQVTNHTGFDGKVAGTDPIVVATDALNTKTYSIYLKSDNASVDCNMTDVKILSSATSGTYANVTDANSYPVNGTGVLSVNIPYSEYSAYDQSYLMATLPEDAKLFYVDASKKLQDLNLVTEAGAPAATQLPAISAMHYDGETKTGGVLTPLTLVVASEAITGSITANTTVYDDTFVRGNRGKFKAYTLTVKKIAARSGCALTALSVYDTHSEKRISATIQGYTATVTLPYYFDATKAGQKANLYLDYTTTGGEDVKLTGKGTSIKPLTFKEDGSVSTGEPLVLDAATPALKMDTSATPNADHSGCSTAVSTVALTAEDTKGTATYTLVVKVASPEKGADLTSVKINNVTGRPDANNQITIALPHGAEVTHLIPEFTVSTNAWVSTSAAPATAIAPDTAFNFTVPQTFIVHSEDNSNTTTYKITVTVADEFIDVPKDAWYYDAVMAASAAGIVLGDGAGHFYPNTNVTRGQFAQFIARADGYKSADYMGKTPFTDVKGDNEQGAAIAYCYEKGYIKGKGDTTFAPNETITREQMAVILCGVLDLVPVTAPKAKFADDGKISSWASGAVYACYEAGKLAGVGDNKFNPQGVATRSQAAAVCVRISK